MLGWLFPAKCPVSAERQTWLEWGMNWLGDQFGVKRMLARPVSLFTPEFFPEPFDHSRRAAEIIFRRVCRYMEISRERVSLTFYVNERDDIPGVLREGQWEGAAGLYQADEQGQIAIGIDEAQLQNPISLIATMAHELGHVHLLGDNRISPDSPDHEPLTDLLTTLYGLGVFTANSVISESNWSDGQYSGWSIGRQGYLTGPEHGYALALLAHARGESRPEWGSHLRLDVRSPFRKGLRFLRSLDRAPFPKEIDLISSPADDVPWTQAKPATEVDWDDDSDLPPWARTKPR